MKINRRKIGIISGIVVMLFGAVFFLRHKSSFEVAGNPQLAQIGGSVSKITGTTCENYERRPLAVMFASDPVARPLYGISQADIVFEMPVTPGGVTRMMGVFQCQEPIEIGSIRSARKDFIPLASSVGAIYTHWGGEQEALASLNSKIVDNIDAMKYEGSTFYRKTKVKPPHNGFTSFEKLILRAENLGYVLKSSFTGYPHTLKEGSRSMSNIATSISIPYTQPYDIVWNYNSESHLYERIRGEKPEIDGLTNETVKASVVAVIRTTASYTDEFYQDVDLEGEGDAMVYQQGIGISARWQKNSELGSKMQFVSPDGKEIEFTPGKIWIEIVMK